MPGFEVAGVVLPTVDQREAVGVVARVEGERLRVAVGIRLLLDDDVRVLHVREDAAHRLVRADDDRADGRAVVAVADVEIPARGHGLGDRVRARQERAGVVRLTVGEREARRVVARREGEERRVAVGMRLLLDDDRAAPQRVREDAGHRLAGRERDRARRRLSREQTAEVRSQPAGTFSETEYVPGLRSPELSCWPSESEKPFAS